MKINFSISEDNYYVQKWGEGWNFEQWNFRMFDVLNLKINERSNVELPNLRVNKIWNKNWEIWFILKGKYKNWQNCE